MIVEQLLKDIQKLVARGTINLSAKISIRGRIEIYDNNIDYIEDFDGDNLIVGVHESSYNQLILFITEK